MIVHDMKSIALKYGKIIAYRFLKQPTMYTGCYVFLYMSNVQHAVNVKSINKSLTLTLKMH